MRTNAGFNLVMVDVCPKSATPTQCTNYNYELQAGRWAMKVTNRAQGTATCGAIFN